ncbi:MAG TPA: hypothetical protein VNE40_02440 [Candidatus Dormibacteraeota bacterium]|nr:hypothetical protein [Candidatus Dormibacteraeota bacterium]
MEQQKDDLPSVDEPESKIQQRIFLDRQLFMNSALNMSWQLAIVVLVPVIGGYKLGQHFKFGSFGLLAGLGLAIIMSGLLFKRQLSLSVRQPSPKKVKN